MPTRETNWSPGTPCWVDYQADDIDAAKAFYRDVLGWDYNEGDPQYGGYLLALTKGLNAAGMMPKMDPSQPTAWVTYFASDDTDATAEAVRSAGGTIVAGPVEVGLLGKMLVAIDPQGAVFGVWQGGEHIGVSIYNEPGSLVWNEAAMTDPDAAREFYGSVFEFRFDAIEGAEAYTTFATGEAPLGGLGGHTPGSPHGWMACFSVASTDAAVAAAERGGAKVITPPQDTPYGRFAVVEDPWGAPFELMAETTES